MPVTTLANSIQSFRNVLIRDTIIQAATNSRFYMSHLGRLAQEIHDVQDLPVLPVTTKALMRAQRSTDLVTSDKEPFITQHTSGTTDKPFHVYRNESEVRFIQQFFKAPIEDLEREDFQICAFQPSYHGQGIPVPTTRQYRKFNIVDGSNCEAQVDEIASEFEQTQRSPMIITGIFQHIKYLTFKLIEKGIDLDGAPVAGVYVTGQYVSDRWRNLLESAWKSRVVPRFSLTEGFGGAMLCDRCGGYHFDQFCVPEVLDFGSGNPLETGIGLLHLTSLFPFVQMMPFIRYRTGDIVEIFESKCSLETGPSFRFLGRLDHAQIFETTRTRKVLVPATIFSDLLEKHPIVALGVARDSRAFVESSSPCFRLRSELGVSKRLIVDVELRVQPWNWQSELKTIREALRSDFRLSNPNLAKELDDSDVELDFNFLPRSSIGPLEPASIPESSDHEYSAN